MCAQDSGRSQMAAAFTKALSQGRVNVRSAGSEPGGHIDPVVVEAMAEAGIAIHENFPKPMTGEVARAADVIITLGCGDACPIYPGKRYLDWEITDPPGSTSNRSGPSATRSKPMSCCCSPSCSRMMRRPERATITRRRSTP